MCIHSAKAFLCDVLCNLLPNLYHIMIFVMDILQQIDIQYKYNRLHRIRSANVASPHKSFLRIQKSANDMG